MNDIVGILLAAGNSRRFGAHKLLHPLPSGEPIGIAAARKLVTAVPKSVAVIRPGDQELRNRLEALGLGVIENTAAKHGMGLSLAAGVSATPESAGWLIALADMPWIAPRTIISLAKALDQGAALVAPVYRGRRGHPVGFNQKWRGQLQSLSGDKGASSVLAQYGSQLTMLSTEDPGVLLDVDHQVDLCEFDRDSGIFFIR